MPVTTRTARREVGGPRKEGVAGTLKLALSNRSRKPARFIEKKRKSQREEAGNPGGVRRTSPAKNQ